MGRRVLKKRRIAPLERSLAFKRPYLMREWHPTKNGDLNAFEIYPYSDVKIWWKCQNKECQYEWCAKPGHRYQKQTGCPSCVRRQLRKEILSKSKKEPTK